MAHLQILHASQDRIMSGTKVSMVYNILYILNEKM